MAKAKGPESRPCGRCHNVRPVRAGLSCCDGCLAQMAAYHRRRREFLFLKMKCQTCKADSRTKNCPACRDRHRLRMRMRRARAAERGER